MRAAALAWCLCAGASGFHQPPRRRVGGPRGRRGDERRAAPRGDGDEPPSAGPGWLENLDDEIVEDLRVYTQTLAICLLIRFFLVEPRFIPSLSMYPGLDVGDQLAVEKVTKIARPLVAHDRFPIHRNEVVVFDPPPAFKRMVDGRARNEALIKRVVAVAGDSVEVRAGRLLVNGAAQDEPFINERPNYELDRLTVPAGCVFVLGDNRNQSLDGHIWGFLPVENVIGRAVFKYWPPQRAGAVAVPAFS